MKYALVTGGSRGIGRAICLALAKMDYYILINYRSNQSAAQETLDLIEAAGGQGTFLAFDVSDPQAIEKAVNVWQETHPDSCIEVLVNNAGVRHDALLMWMKDEEWRSVLSTNLDSVFYLTRLIIKGMLSQKYGRIINVVSLSGLKGMPGQMNYSAAKAGVIGATKALAQEIARRNITVNAVAPGFIKTDMTADIDEKAYKAVIPMRRFGTAEEVSAVVAFLASKQASYITGEIISVNGGLYT